MAGERLSAIGDGLLEIGNSCFAAAWWTAGASIIPGIVIGGAGLALSSVGAVMEWASGGKSKEQGHEGLHSEKTEKLQKNKKRKFGNEEYEPLLSHAQSMGIDDETHDYRHSISSSNVHLSKPISSDLEKAGYKCEEHRNPETKELIEKTYYAPGKKEPSFTINKNGAYLKDPQPSAETIRATLSEMGSKDVRPKGDAEFQAKVFMEAKKLNIKCEISPEALEIVKAQQQKQQAAKVSNAIAPRENVNYKPVEVGTEKGKEYILLKKADEKISGHYKLTKDECTDPQAFEKIKSQHENGNAEAISVAKDGNKWQINSPKQEQEIRQSQVRQRTQSTSDSDGGRPKSRGIS